MPRLPYSISTVWKMQDRPLGNLPGRALGTGKMETRCFSKPDPCLPPLLALVLGETLHTFLRLKVVSKYQWHGHPPKRIGVIEVVLYPIVLEENALCLLFGSWGISSIFFCPKLSQSMFLYRIKHETIFRDISPSSGINIYFRLSKHTTQI